MFSCDLIPGNVDLRAKDFHGEPYYDIGIDCGPAFQRFDAVDPTVFTTTFHDAEVVLLSPGCS